MYSVKSFLKYVFIIVWSFLKFVFIVVTVKCSEVLDNAILKFVFIVVTVKCLYKKFVFTSMYIMLMFIVFIVGTVKCMYINIP